MRGRGRTSPADPLPSPARGRQGPRRSRGEEPGRRHHARLPGRVRRPRCSCGDCSAPSDGTTCSRRTRGWPSGSGSPPATAPRRTATTSVNPWSRSTGRGAGPPRPGAREERGPALALPARSFDAGARRPVAGTRARPSCVPGSGSRGARGALRDRRPPQPPAGAERLTREVPPAVRRRGPVHER